MRTQVHQGLVTDKTVGVERVEPQLAIGIPGLVGHQQVDAVLQRLVADWRETMSTHRIHDDMLDFTAQNGYKGNAVMMRVVMAQHQQLDREGGNGCANRQMARRHMFQGGVRV
ncbi:hypothetical protein KSS93_19315 [Pseudomonas xanthosomatis]|uniref:hypothetical protein n=1 Tax=Pseudomonas xanthosomatis TaxID=2842356 RepID=UPI001C3CE118|nr:hypothetical protein [Pseudomonas xanthosomatis]QXH49005.1 hypothetical protein KSS93_19315 [Pseudomonas xanthosomatis]